MTYITNYQSKLGNILLASDGTNLIGLWFKNQKYYLNKINDELIKNNNLEIFHQTKKWLDKYFQGIKVSPNELKLKPNGSPFQQEVWKILCTIPYGKTTTYKDIAQEIAQKHGKPSMSAQAVGGAVGHNPISIIIPCHRVIGSNGSLTGYAGGIDKKLALLKLEKTNLNNPLI